MRPTRRGIGVLFVFLVAAAVLGTVGQPGLRAVVVGLAVVVLGSVVQVWWLSPPTVERTGLTPGHVGESRTVELRMDAPDPYLATVRDHTSAGLTQVETATTVGGEPVTYDLGYERRGVHRVGPLEVRARDLLGLFSRRFTVEAEQSLVVYPRVRELAGAGLGVPALAAATGVGVDREFAHLREYQPGDSPRDVDWRATAKRDELVVAEYDERGETAVVIAAGGPRREADTLAEAVASVALGILATDTAVGLALPDQRVSPRRGQDQRERLLDALARTDGGPRPEADAAVEVEVLADGRVRIDAGGTETTLGWPPADGSAAARKGGGRS